MKIAFTSVYVSDPIKAFQFYIEVLGFVEVMFMPNAMLAIVASASDPKGTALLLEPNQNPIAKTYQDALYAANLPCIVFGSDNLQEDYERLKSKGVQFRSEPKSTEWGIQVVMEDGFGNLIQLHQDPT